jgi:hypothetical protein
MSKKQPVITWQNLITVIVVVAGGVAFPYTTFETRASATRTRETVLVLVDEMKVLNTKLSELVGYLKGKEELQKIKHNKPSNDSD